MRLRLQVVDGHAHCDSHDLEIGCLGEAQVFWALGRLHMIGESRGFNDEPFRVQREVDAWIIRRVDGASSRHRVSARGALVGAHTRVTSGEQISIELPGGGRVAIRIDEVPPAVRAKRPLVPRARAASDWWIVDEEPGLAPRVARWRGGVELGRALRVSPPEVAREHLRVCAAGAPFPRVIDAASPPWIVVDVDGVPLAWLRRMLGDIDPRLYTLCARALHTALLENPPDLRVRFTGIVVSWDGEVMLAGAPVRADDPGAHRDMRSVLAFVASGFTSEAPLELSPLDTAQRTELRAELRALVGGGCALQRAAEEHVTEQLRMLDEAAFAALVAAA